MLPSVECLEDRVSNFYTNYSESSINDTILKSEEYYDIAHGIEMKDRPKHAVSLAKSICELNLGLIHSSALNMMHSYVKVGPSKLSLKSLMKDNSRMLKNDLMGSGTIVFIESLKSFDPNKGSLSTFMIPRIAAVMYKTGLTFYNNFPIEFNKLKTMRKELYLAKGSFKDFIINTKDIVVSDTKKSKNRLPSEISAYIYHALTNSHLIVSQENDDVENIPRLFYLNNFEPSYSCFISPEQYAIDAQKKYLVDKILNSVSKTHRDIVIRKFYQDKNNTENSNCALEDQTKIKTEYNKFIRRQRTNTKNQLMFEIL